MALDQIDVDKHDKNMSFLEHLEELRWHLVRSVAVVASLAIVAFIFGTFIFDNIIFSPARENFITYRILCDISYWLYDADNLCIGGFEFNTQNITVAGQLIYHLTISMITGIIVAFPYILWEFWRFLKPALKPSERSRTTGVVLVSSMLFMIGIVFGYLILTPLSLSFMGNYSVSDMIQNVWTIQSYVSFVTTLTLATGIVFELPLIIYFLSKLGLVGKSFLKKYRKHAMVVTLILSSIITPPDVMSQILLSFPIYVLYEIGIIIAGRVERQREKDTL